MHVINLRLGNAVPVLCVCVASCSSTTPRPEPEKIAASVRNFGGTTLARDLEDLLCRIERGDMKAWDLFTAYPTAHLSGEHAETYDTACGELARRDPTIFLRRHLMGDRRAIPTGKRAYGWIGTEGRHTMNWLHESRLQLANDREERRKIEEYVAALHSVLSAIDKKWENSLFD